MSKTLHLPRKCSVSQLETQDKAREFPLPEARIGEKGKGEGRRRKEEKVKKGEGEGKGRRRRS